MSFKLNPQLDADTRLVTSLELCEVLLMNDSRYLWCILVPRLPDLRDFHDVPPAHKAMFQAEIDRVSAVADRLSGAYKMNVAALGNMVEQLHVHVIARHQSDAAWPGPVWGVGDVEPYGEAQADKLIAQLRDELTGT
jgi:diadenosine tetraphosphate (Ap4A) HIT family hydrolase